jgi:hypothetical protein
MVSTAYPPAEIVEPAESLEEPVILPTAEPSAWTWEEAELVQSSEAVAKTPEGPPVEEAVGETGAEELASEDTEVVLTPGVLEEPVPGMGWTPSADLATEETLREEFARIPEDNFPYVAPEAELEESYPEVEHPAVPPLEEVTPYTAVAPAADSVRTEESPTPAVAPTTVDDLKARIEETRRRIRRELEQPFLNLGEREPATGETGSEAPADGFTPAAPAAFAESPPELMAEIDDGYEVIELDTEPERGAVAAPESLGEPSVEEVSDERSPAEKLRASLAVPSEVPESMELGVDYDAMRARIEKTRGRLKSKAFDAMMTGEASLLSKDSSDSWVEKGSIPAVDPDVDDTIEANLREEDR